MGVLSGVAGFSKPWWVRVKVALGNGDCDPEGSHCRDASAVSYQGFTGYTPYPCVIVGGQHVLAEVHLVSREPGSLNWIMPSM